MLGQVCIPQVHKLQVLYVFMGVAVGELAGLHGVRKW